MNIMIKLKKSVGKLLSNWDLKIMKKFKDSLLAGNNRLINLKVFFLLILFKRFWNHKKKIQRSCFMIIFYLDTLNPKNKWKKLRIAIKKFKLLKSVFRQIRDSKSKNRFLIKLGILIYFLNLSGIWALSHVYLIQN